MKLRSGKQLSTQSELLQCDSEKESAKGLKTVRKIKGSCKVISAVDSETIHNSSVNEDSGDFHPRHLAAPSIDTGTEVAVMKRLGHISSLPDALTNLSAKSSNSTVTKDEVLTCIRQASDTSSHYSRRSIKERPANVCTKLPSLQSSKMSTSNSSNVRCPAQDNSPIIIDVTNIRKDQTKRRRNVSSVVNSIIHKKSESIAVVHESDDCILEIPNIKQRCCDRSVEMVPQNMKTKTSNVPTVPVHKDKCSGQEDDACSVISLGSDVDGGGDDDVIILDSDPEPRLDCSSASDIFIYDTIPSEKRVPTSGPVTINLCTSLSQSSIISKSPVHRIRKSMICNDKTMKLGNKHKQTMKRRIQHEIHKKPNVKDYVSVLGNVPHTSDRPKDMPQVTNYFPQQSYMPFSTATSTSSALATATSCNITNAFSYAVIAASSTTECNQMNVTSSYSSNLKYPNPSAMRQDLQSINNQLGLAGVPSSSVFGTNFYNPNPGHARVGLRPVVIDGSNVALGHTNGRIFSCRGLQICIDYFQKRNHRVVAFVPQFRKSPRHSLDTEILDRLEKIGLVSFTPSRKVGDRLVVPYDDRYIVQYAAECGGVIVSTDNYRDLLQENPAWRETIEMRLLMFTWVGDVLMFPQDPLGRNGPNLERFLRFP